MKPEISLPFKGKFPITFRFGENPDWYVRVVGYPHNGVDFGMPVFTSIRACDKGVIQYADNLPDADGLGINIKHSWGLSQYWHLSGVPAREGTRVSIGQTIGLSGDTGFATGPHLHFGVKVQGQKPAGMYGWSDPLEYISDKPEVLPPPAPSLKSYLVRPGDSLWKIALKFYGNGYQWRKIFDANKDKIRDPALIYPLQRLLIP